jgi:hypothetical protein
MIPPEARSVTEALDPRTPDGIRAFRIRAVASGVASLPSPEASYVRAVRAASDILAWRGSDERHHIAWVPRSPNGSPLLERRLVRGDGVASAWIALTGLEFDGTYADADTAAWIDGSHFEYRVSYAVGDLTSDVVATSGPTAPPLPLGSFSAIVIGGVVRVAWTYPGVAPVDVTVQRRGELWGLTTVGTVMSPASSLDDAPPATGVWFYTAQARLHGASAYDPGAASDVVQTAVLVPDASWTGVVDAFLRMMPLAVCAARDSSGRFVLVSSAPAEWFTIHSEDASGFTSWESPAGSALIPPCALVDETDRIHVLYRANWAGAADILHWWRDAAGWQEERVTTAGGYNSGPIASLDRAGNPSLVWYDAATRWARMEAGAWVIESLPAPYDTVSPTSPLAFDPAGDPALIAYGPSLVRRSSGIWAATSVPDALPASVHDLWAPGADQAIVGYWNWSAAGGADYWVRSWTPAGWSAPENALSATGGSSFAAAATTDGSRVAVAAMGFPATIAIRDGGVWRTIALANHAGSAAVGFGPDGRWWALFGLAQYVTAPSPEVAYVLYEEH